MPRKDLQQLNSLTTHGLLIHLAERLEEVSDNKANKEDLEKVALLAYSIERDRVRLKMVGTVIVRVSAFVGALAALVLAWLGLK